MSLGDFTDRLSKAYDDVSSSVSETVDDVKQGISATVDEVREDVAEAIDDIQAGAAQAYADVSQAAGELVDDVAAEANAAAQWAGHQADAFSSALEERLNPEAAAAKREEGAISDAAASPATLPQDQPVDLRDKAKRAEFLAQWGQFDKDDRGTTTDAGRCQSNTAMAGLLMKGGPEELKKGLEAAKAEAEKRAAAESDPDRKKMLEESAKRLGETAAALGENKATPQQMDQAADALYKTFAEKGRIDPKTGELQRDAMDAEGVEDLEKTLGLSPKGDWEEVKERSWIDPRGWGNDDNEEVTEQIWDKLKPGQQAHVTVHGANTYLAQGKGPHGEPIQEDARGKYYIDEEKLRESRRQNPGDSEAVHKAAARVDLKGGIGNHAILMGRTENGARYIYNPGANPPYIHENPANPGEFDRKAAQLIGRKGKDDYYANVTPYS